MKTGEESYKNSDTDWRYITSTMGGAMFGAALAGVWGALIGGFVGIYIATVLSKKER